MSYGLVLSNIYVNTAREREHQGEYKLYKQLPSCKTGGLFARSSSSRLIYPHTHLVHSLGSCQGQPPSGPAPASRGDLRSEILRWAIWSLSEDWCEVCEVLVKFKMISVPGAGRNNEVLIGMLSYQPPGSLTRHHNINKHKHNMQCVRPIIRELADDLLFSSSQTFPENRRFFGSNK